MPKNTTLRLTEELEAQIKIVSRVLNKSEAEIGREAIASYCTNVMAKPSFKKRAVRIMDAERKAMLALFGDGGADDVATLDEDVA